MLTGNTYYYFTIDSNKDVIFIVSSKISNEIPITKEGDKVKVIYEKGQKGSIDITEFNNLEINSGNEDKISNN